MLHTSAAVCQYYSYDRLTTTMDRHTETVDIYSILNPVFFVSKILGLSPYNAVGDVGNRNIIVTVPAIIYSLAMFILNIAVLAYGAHTALINWENICSSGESITFLETVCLAVFAYFTSLLRCRQTARQIARLNDLIGKTYYSAWKKDLQLLLTTQVLFVIMIVTTGVLDISQVIRESYEITAVLAGIFYYVAELAVFMSEYQFVVFMHILKRTVQNWNNNIDTVSENDDVTNVPWCRNEMDRQKSILYIVLNNSVNSEREKIHSKLMHFKQLRELHASACDIAESVNAVYSPMLLLSVARLFTVLAHILHYILRVLLSIIQVSFVN